MRAAPAPAPTKDRLIRLPEVRSRTGLHPATLYRKIKAGTFPSQRRLSVNCVGWYESEIDEWVANPR